MLQELLDAFKPAQAAESATGEPDLTDEAWHTYFILEQAFVQGKSRDFLADALGLGQRQYYRRQAEALDALTDRLWTLEQSYRVTTPTAPGDIPRISHFVGRAEELSYYRERLQQDHLAIITGLAGAGKTALGAEMAAAQQQRGPVLWLTFRYGINTDVDATVHDIALLLKELGQAAYWDFLQAKTGERPPLNSKINHLLSALEADRCTLCLDNYELVNHDAVFTSLMHILRKTTSRSEPVDLIVMSREKPNFAVDLDIRPLAGLTADDARRLLAEGGLNNLPAPLFQRVYQITEGNPKFLQLFSAWVTENQLSDFEDPSNVASVTAFIDGLWREPDIEQFLLVQVSKALTPDEARLLQVVAAFRRPFDDRDQAIVELCAASGVQLPIAVLHGLVRRHILTRSAGTREIDCHALIRRYFYDRLREQPALKRDVHRRIGVYYEDSRGDFLEAAYHYREAGEYADVARLLDAHRDQLIGAGHAQRVLDLLAPINPRDVRSSDWATIAATKGEARTFLSDDAGTLARAETAEATVSPRPIAESPPGPTPDQAGRVAPMPQTLAQSVPAGMRSRRAFWVGLAAIAVVSLILLVVVSTRLSAKGVNPERGTTADAMRNAALPLREDWESGIDTERWLIFGDPQPAVYPGKGRDESSTFNSNGDDIFASGLISRDAFDVSEGIHVQWWLRGHGAGPRKYSISQLGFSTCSPAADAEQCRGWVAYIEASYAENQITYVTPQQQWREPWDPLDDEWHQYSFTILPNGLVRFFRDGQLKHTTDAPLDLTTNEPLWLHIEGRSLNAYYYVDDVAVWPVYDGSVTARYHFEEEFASAVGFTSTHPELVYVDEANSRAVLNISTRETRLLRRPIPELYTGDFRVTVKGQFNTSDNNCDMSVFLTQGELTFDNRGDGPLLRTAFAFNGGGCPNYFDHISAIWRYPDRQYSRTDQGYVCGGPSGTVIPIQRGVPYTAELQILSSVGMGTLTVYDEAGELVGQLVGPAGFQPDVGRLDTLSLGHVGRGDWPACSGYIDSVLIETIDRDGS